MKLIVLITLAAVAISGCCQFLCADTNLSIFNSIASQSAKSDQPVYNTSDIQTNLQLINTYNEIMKTPAILDIVIDELGLDMSVGSLNGKITVQSAKNSQVVNVTVQDPDPYKAAEIANKVAEVFQAKIVEIMNVDNVSILAVAEVGENASPVKPQPMLNIAIALVVGLMAGVG